MNIIILITNGKDGSKLSGQICCRGANYRAIETNESFCLSFHFLSLDLMGGQPPDGRTDWQRGTYSANNRNIL
jgi:hypothetical protein